MTRYDPTKSTSVRFDGKMVFLTRLYPPIPIQDSDISYISKETDYLDVLATKYYNDASLYWIIGQANNIGKGRLSVEGGLQLRIPTNISQIINNFNALNK